MTREEIGTLITAHEFATLRPGFSQALGRIVEPHEVEATRDERRAWLEARIADVQADISKHTLYATQLGIYLSALQSALDEVVLPVTLPEPPEPPALTWWERAKAYIAKWTLPAEPEPKPVAPPVIPAVAPPQPEAVTFQVKERVTLQKFNGDIGPNSRPVETIEIDEHGNVTRKDG